jgi:hypothetical protein
MYRFAIREYNAGTDYNSLGVWKEGCEEVDGRR